MKVTGQNLWKIAERIDGEYVPSHAAYRYAIHFRAVQGYTTYPLMVLVSEFMQGTPMGVRDILAMEINKYYKGELPMALQILLDVPDDMVPKAWKEHDPFHAYKQAPGGQIWVPPTQFEGMTAQEVYNGNLAWPSNTMPTEAVNGQTVVRDLTKFIPGLKAREECPVPGCYAVDSVLNLVQHLNDHSHQWSREKIADWLETLDVDLSFLAEAPEAPLLPKARRDRLLVIIGRTYQQCRREADYRRRREGKDAVLVTEGSTPHRLAGLPKGVQYCVIGGIELDPRLAGELTYIGAVEVGDEEVYPAWNSGIESTLKQVYSKQIAYQAKSDEIWNKLVDGQAESDEIWHKTFFTKKPPQQGAIAHFTVSDEVSSLAQDAPAAKHVAKMKALVEDMSKYYNVPVTSHDSFKDVEWLGSSASSLDTPPTPETLKKTALESKKNPSWATFNQPSKNPFKKK